MELDVRDILLNLATSATFLIALFGVALLVEGAVTWLEKK